MSRQSQMGEGGMIVLWLCCLTPVLVGAAETLADSAEVGQQRSITSPLSDARAAREQTVDAVRWLARRKQFVVAGVPYGFTGLPMFYYVPNTGWNMGARLQLVDYRRRPYRYKVTLNLQRSNKGKKKSFISVKVPNISGTGFGVAVLASNKRDLNARYYGDNDSIYDRLQDRHYYYYELANPRFIFRLLRHLAGPTRLGLSLGLERTEVNPRKCSSSLDDECSSSLDNAGLPGPLDGVTGFVGISMAWDSRDDETVPERGVFHEWSYETSRSSVLAFLFEQIDFRRYTFTDARHYPIGDRLNLANRVVFEVLAGSAPLYAFGEIGGSTRTKGLGGSDSLRGYDRQRFADNVRFFTNSELRYRLHSAWVFRQYLEWHLISFADTGRVWPHIDQLTIRGLHMTGGIGLRLYWNQDFVVRTGFAVSSEQTYVILNYRNLF